MNEIDGQRNREKTTKERRLMQAETNRFKKKKKEKKMK